MNEDNVLIRVDDGKHKGKYVKIHNDSKKLKVGTQESGYNTCTFAMITLPGDITLFQLPDSNPTKYLAFNPDQTWEESPYVPAAKFTKTRTESTTPAMDKACKD